MTANAVRVMKTSVKIVLTLALAGALGGCVYDPGYVRYDGDRGGAYYGPAYDSSPYGDSGYYGYSPGYYGGYGYGYPAFGFGLGYYGYGRGYSHGYGHGHGYGYGGGHGYGNGHGHWNHGGGNPGHGSPGGSRAAAPPVRSGGHRR